jgi:predicted SnoaL-like aldol condensation-catalyzing enzyme
VAGMDRSPQDVADSHLAAVIAGDPVAMAADYAKDAILERGADVYRGHAAIAAYFASVPERLGAAAVVFDTVEVDQDMVSFGWHLDGGDVAASGTDVCRVVEGAIVHQVVRLNNSDF